CYQRVGAEIEASAYLVQCGRLLADDNFRAPSFQRQRCGKAAHAAANDGNAWRARHPSPTRTHASSFDHLVGAGEQDRGNFEAKRFRGLEIDDELELDRLFDWKVGRLRPAQNLVDVVGGTPGQVLE